MGEIRSGLREGASRYALLPAFVTAQHVASRRRRAVHHAYREGARFRRHSQSWSDDQRLEWIEARMGDVVRHAFSNVPYYRQRLRAAGFDPRDRMVLGDLDQLPVLS